MHAMDSFEALKALREIEQEKIKKFSHVLEGMYKEISEAYKFGNRKQFYLRKQDGSLHLMSPEGINVAIWDPAIPIDCSLRRECLTPSEYVENYVTRSEDVDKISDYLFKNENIQIQLFY